MKKMERPDAVLIAGPTAAGKTRFALRIATKYNGEIINTDSMQVYDGLPILTAKPTKAELSNITHHLLGHRRCDVPYSVSSWLGEVVKILDELKQRDRTPIFVGGTGLYYKALFEGIASVPEIPDDVRRQIRSDLASDGAESLHSRLQELDPEGASTLKPKDGNRIARALEVVVTTGRPLSFFHSQPVGEIPMAGLTVEKHLMMPKRSVLHARINHRTDKMVNDGVVEEVRQFLDLGLPDDAPLSKAIGVFQLKGYINNEIGLDRAIEDIKTMTRRYAKRQCTWINNQFSTDWKKVD